MCGGRATELLIALIRAVDGTAYLCGGGPGGYQDDASFADNGLGLVYQSFTHPVYQQFNTDSFVPGLSVVDALMSCGFPGTRELLLHS